MKKTVAIIIVRKNETIDVCNWDIIMWNGKWYTFSWNNINKLIMLIMERNEGKGSTLKLLIKTKNIFKQFVFVVVYY